MAPQDSNQVTNFVHCEVDLRRIEGPSKQRPEGLVESRLIRDPAGCVRKGFQVNHRVICNLCLNVPLYGGERRCLTSLLQGVASPRWSSKRLARTASTRLCSSVSVSWRSGSSTPSKQTGDVFVDKILQKCAEDG